MSQKIYVDYLASPSISSTAQMCRQTLINFNVCYILVITLDFIFSITQNIGVIKTQNYKFPKMTLNDFYHYHWCRLGKCWNATCCANLNIYLVILVHVALCYINDLKLFNIAIIASIRWCQTIKLLQVLAINVSHIHNQYKIFLIYYL